MFRPRRFRLGLDERVVSPYLASMANRLFITLLALLTGLAAQVGPVQARGCASSGAEIGAVASVVVEKGQAVTAALASVSGKAVDRQAIRFDVPARRDEFRPAPSVRTGIDRARE